MMEPSILIAAAAAFVACMALVPIAKYFATRVNLVDRPDARRKLHRKPIPLAGGIAVLAAIVIAIVATGLLVMPAGHDHWFKLNNFLAIFAGAFLLLIIGVIDDRHGMSGKTKLLGQVLAICLFLLLGQSSHEMNLFGFHIPSYVGVGLICIWLLGTINAVNLIDGADGMASTVGAVASIALVIMSAVSGRSAEAVLAAAMAGAIIAFLIYNFPPASVFLGDAGSMMIGFLIGAVAVTSSSKEATTLVMVAPIAVVVIPLFDSFVAILRRRLTGRSIYTVDRGHIHHALMANGYGPKKMLVVVAILSIVSAVGGTLSAILNSSLPAVITVALVVGTLVLGRVFGFAEFQLLKNKLFNMGSAFLTAPHKDGGTREQCIQLQGSRDWNQLWRAITEFADIHEMAQVRLDLNLPWLHEGYHATWQRPVRIDPQECWKTSLPLSADGKAFGRLEIVGPLSRDSVYVLLSLLSELLESMESVILRLASEDGHSTPAPKIKVPRRRVPAPVTSSSAEDSSINQPVGSGA